MGWQVSRKTEHNVELYRIWSTIVDEWITEWLTREQMMKFFFWQRFREFTEKYLEDFITFPSKYLDKDTLARVYSKEKLDAFNFIMSKDEDNAIFEKLAEIITQQGIVLNITDTDGYRFDSKEDGHNNEVAVPVIEEPVFTRQNNPNYFKLLDLKNVKRWREEDNGKKRFEDYEIYAITTREITISDWNGSHKLPMANNFEKYVCPAGKKVRVWMVSTQGDVGVTDNLVNPIGYGARVDADKDLKDYEFIEVKHEIKA